MSRLWGLLVLVGLLGAACVSESPGPPGDPTGPPEIRPDVVARHAREFRTDLADRAAGSQGEAAAATYILGHLQQAGYLVRLDGVPVENLVRSTNLVATPPGGDDPEVVVAAGYGTEAGPGRGDLTLGLFLELARALRAAEPGHSVEFVAVGAESTGRAGGGLGSRRLAAALLDDELDPLVITVSVVAGADAVVVRGSEARTKPFIDLAGEHGLRATPGGPQASVFSRAGFDHVWVQGPEEVTGEVVLDYLADYSR